MAYNKRKHSSGSRETIDLTQDNEVNHRTHKAPKVLHGYNGGLPTPESSVRGFGSSQSFRGSQSYSSSQNSYEDEHDDGDVDAPGSTQAANEAHALTTYVLYGSMPGSIVGVRYYSGNANDGEMVMLRREPHNPYDSNAIQVLNVHGVQIGHIPRQLAAKLRGYMDSRALMVEAHVNGEKGPFTWPLKLYFYGTSSPEEQMNLSAQMEKDGLKIGEYRKREKAAKKREAQMAKARKAAEKAAKNGGCPGGMGAQQWENQSSEFVAGLSQATDVAAMDDIMMQADRFNPRSVEQIVEEFGVSEDDLAKMPSSSQPSSIATRLLPYQLQGLKWMLDKESPQLPPVGSKEVVRLWTRSAKNSNMFVNLATNYSIEKPVLASGGILADDMGLGKTIQVISLIMADRELKRTGSGVSDATLILSPLSVMSNWSTQMQKHLQPDKALRVLTYHGAKRVKLNSKGIGNYDVVITTYETAMTEYWAMAKPVVPSKQGLFSINWRRVVLDEGHNIRNPNSKKAVAASSLLAQSRWALTGTPIINSLRDLFSLAKFLRLSGGLDQFELFNGALIRPVNQGSSHGHRLLQQLMGDLTLRRKKEMKFVDLRLPELYQYVYKVNFLDHEKEKYDMLAAEAKGELDRYRNNRGGAAATKTFTHLLEVLLRMRQVCNHWKMCGEERVADLMSQLENQKTVDLTPENKATLQRMLQLPIENQDDCCICYDILKDPVITVCAHVFCYSCIERAIDLQQKCPMCRAELPSTGSVVRPAKEESLPQPEIDINTSSSKVEALLAILKASRQEADTKTIIFSQWTSFLDIVQAQLTANDYKYCRIDGRMNPQQRDASLEALESDPECTIMLASLGVCSVGLNLVAANQVIMADSWWAPAIEDQAVDRVHRLGQKRETTVFRLVVEDSIEQRVLQIQEDKRTLMRLAFAEKEGEQKGKKKGASARLADIERLLG